MPELYPNIIFVLIFIKFTSLSNIEIFHYNPKEKKKTDRKRIKGQLEVKSKLKKLLQISKKS